MRKSILFFLLFLVLISSCRIEKRKYSKGYFIEWNKNHSFLKGTEIDSAKNKVSTKISDEYNSMNNVCKGQMDSVLKLSVKSNIKKEVFLIQKLNKNNSSIISFNEFQLNIKTNKTISYERSESNFVFNKNEKKENNFYFTKENSQAKKRSSPKKKYLFLKILIAILFVTALLFGIFNNIGIGLVLVLIGTLLSILLMVKDKDSRLFGGFGLLFGLIDLIVFFILIITSFG